MSLAFRQLATEPLPAKDARRVIGFRICDPNVFATAPAPGAWHFQRIRPPGFYCFRFYCPCGCMAEGNVLVAQGFRPTGGFFWNGHFSCPTLDPAIHLPGHLTARLDLGLWHIESPAVAPLSLPL